MLIYQSSYNTGEFAPVVIGLDVSRSGGVLRLGYTIGYDSNSGPAIFLNQQGYFSQETIASTDVGVTPAFNWVNRQITAAAAARNGQVSLTLFW